MFGFDDMEKECCRELKMFLQENKEFFGHVIVQSFLKKKENKCLLIEAICTGNKDIRKKIDTEFKKFYFQIRFTTFISDTLYYNAINYDKRIRKIAQRHPLIINKPVGEEDGNTLEDVLMDPYAEIKIEDLLQSSSIEDYIVDSVLYEALKELPPKQKQVIDLAYVKGLSNTEISKRLGKTQQAVSKLHKKALEKINKTIIQKGGVIRDGH
ncbi:sigma-70 family RNA polymerase sigma factor [Bacillus xiapuensis]|uniref:sigma-70 family RNA polymerase sigma factor n=1 Tax=Bacillus xiapuensis TaxID=2014075 RepID=UPI0012FE4826|nr:sigma-70 family RNA polymerase sigma factor [Bacillus xiapuensis]